MKAKLPDVETHPAWGPDTWPKHGISQRWHWYRGSYESEDAEYCALEADDGCVLAEYVNRSAEVMVRDFVGELEAVILLTLHPDETRDALLRKGVWREWPPR